MRTARDRRRFWIQAAVLLLVLAAIAFIARNVAVNLDRLGIATGFAFMSRPAGFDIAQHLIAYDESSTYTRVFLVAVINTVLVSAVAIVLATVLGFVIGLARLSSNGLVALVAAAYVEIVRNIPLLLQLLFWYFVVMSALPAPRNSLSLFDLAFLNNRGLHLPAPIFGPGAAATIAALVLGIALFFVLVALERRRRRTTGGASALRLAALAPLVLVGIALYLRPQISWSVPVLAGFNFTGGVAVIPEFVTMAVGLSIYSASFIAEIVRGGVQSVARGQAEAGLALGLSQWRVTSKIVIPLALRAIVPPLGAHYVLLLKNSSLAAAIAYPDLMLIVAGTALNQTGQPLEIMAITLATYLALGLALAAATNAVNRRLALVER